MKLKASRILQDALDLIQAGKQQFACAAIQDAETTVRMELGEEVSSAAQNIFSKFIPSTIHPKMKIYGQWWDKGDPKRIEALQKAIEIAKKRGD